MDNTKILAIETSFDETAVAIMSGRKLISNVLSSSVDLHKKWGGVVPSIARKAHLDNIEYVYKEALQRGGLEIEDIDYIAVTYGPGLAIALEVGLQFAQNLAYDNDKPLIPINHMEGHLLSPFALNSNGKSVLPDGKDIKDFFPAMALLVSGNHTELVYADKIGDYAVIGETLDDAAGEAFDKVARMLNFGYPGGPVINHVVKKYRSENKNWKSTIGEFALPVPMKDSGDLNFSYSGLKTACMYKIKELRESGINDSEWAWKFCNEYIDVVLQSLEIKLEAALKKYPDVRSVIIGGGVMSNEIIVRGIGRLSRSMDRDFLIPEKKLRTDNAGMIGVAAYFQVAGGESGLCDRDVFSLDRVPNLRLGDEVF
ncbi:tRNA (adenosine(37)-N6)-threonylcarbamoyltransferase complex transferase subunit TsaD [Candidatus Dojkabacteria bacterium]|nr:tRNA (adenosine(37)-N6)-threonylcarbamoyltransferase complex transferase subunit TsaD [Candidatus Dojkabacteria bacterium]